VVEEPIITRAVLHACMRRFMSAGLAHETGDKLRRIG